MSKGIDRSWDRTAASAIAAAGYSFVMRYLSAADGGKNIHADEAAELHGAGLDIGLVYESYARRPLEGHAAGVADGQTAVAQAEAIGFPHGCAIYAACDFDATEAQQAPIDDYLRGFTEGMGGKYETGVYGGFYVVSRSKANGSSTKFWQTLAWSGGQVMDGVHIYQNGATDFGGGADVDEARQDNIGSWKADGSHPAPAPNPTPSPVSQNTYTVVAGDTLSGIAARFGTTYQALAALNGIADPNKISVGQVLKLQAGSSPAPTPQPNGTTYVVAAGDTLSGIGQRFGVDWHLIQQINNLPDPNKIYVGQVLRINGGVALSPSGGAVYYTVQSGDTLSGIAQRYGTSYQNIAAINGIADPNKIYAGQVLRVS